MSPRRARLLPLLALAALSAFALPAAADWPMARHDPGRTGLATAKSDITKPVPYFKRYLGGTVSSQGMLPFDVNQDGKTEVVYVTGGRVVAKLPNDDVVWETPPLEIGYLVGIDDLDGDGKPDIVVGARDHAYVLAGADGSVEWAEPDGEMGSLGAVRLGDVNGDGRPDVILQECGCCGVNSGKTGFAYSFGAAFAPTLLWTMPFVACGGSRALTLVNADGQGPAEVLLGAYQTLSLLDGPTGAVLATTPALGTWTSVSNCRGVDLDGVAGEEIVCLLNSSDLPGTSQRKAFALKYDPVAKTLLPIWSAVLAPDAGGDLTWVDPILDLDGDGTLEVVVGAKDAASVWSTVVLDAATGAVLDTIPGERLAGTAPIASPSSSLILTSAGTTLSAWTFSRAVVPPTAIAWTLPDRGVVAAPDWTRVRSTILASRVVTLDLDTDGVQDLVAPKLSAGANVTGYGATTGMPVELASFTFPMDVDPIAIWAVPPLTKMYPQAAIATNDGYLVVYDAKLQPTNADASQGRPGLRVGGYYAAGAWRDLQRSPVVASLDGGAAQAIVVRDSRSALLRLDASTATMVSPPSLVWQKTHAFAPAIVPGLDGGKAGIACLGLAEPVQTPATYVVHALHADGSAIWTQPIETTPFNDLVPGTFDADGVPDLAVQWGDPGDVILRTRGISGATGATLWDAPPVTPGAGRQPAGIAVADWNGDGRDDIVQQAAGTRVTSGVDGSQLLAGGPGDSYFLPMLFDVQGDGSPLEVTLQGGFSPARTLAHDLQSAVWTSVDDDRPYPYGAVGYCPQPGWVLAEGSWQHPARLKVTALAGPSPGVYSTMVLAGGKAWLTEAAAIAGGARIGQLTSATVSANLAGTNTPTAVVGSSDGWLYGVDLCQQSLAFAYGFNAAVGEAVFGDTDGDGRDEIIVSVADGFLYGLKNEALPAPTGVIDTDPDNGITSTDVDAITTADKLSCAWDAVPGAVKYEAAIVRAGFGFVTSPSWVSAGIGTSASFFPLALVDGATYSCAVRAVDAMGHPSVDVVSDGVVVQLPVSMTGSGGAGGMGGASGAGGTGTGTSTGAGGGAGTGGSGAGGMSTGAGTGEGTATGTGTGTGGGTPGDTGGCGCRTAGGSGGALSAGALALAVLGAAARRRRRVA